MYGSLNFKGRQALWSNLRSLDSDNSIPWRLVGDFNAFLTRDEKKGGSIRECSMFDLGFYGPKFTWHRGMTFERIDRAVGNEVWQEVFPGSHVLHLPKVCSDHRPILIQPWSMTTRISSMKQFRFLAPWIEHTDWDSFVLNNWDYNLPLGVAIAKFSERVMVWNKGVFGNIFWKKKRVLARLGGI